MKQFKQELCFTASLSGFGFVLVIIAEVKISPHARQEKVRYRVWFVV